jgi:hypothetical protein
MALLYDTHHTSFSSGITYKGRTDGVASPKNNQLTSIESVGHDALNVRSLFFSYSSVSFH